MSLLHCARSWKLYCYNNYLLLFKSESVTLRTGVGNMLLPHLVSVTQGRVCYTVSGLVTYAVTTSMTYLSYRLTAH